MLQDPCGASAFRNPGKGCLCGCTRPVEMALHLVAAASHWRSHLHRPCSGLPAVVSAAAAAAANPLKPKLAAMERGLLVVLAQVFFLPELAGAVHPFWQDLRLPRDSGGPSARGIREAKDIRGREVHRLVSWKGRAP